MHRPLLAVALGLGLCSTGSAQSSGGPHPSVAPTPPGTTIPTSRLSYLFNIPDGVWNHGEGFPFTPGAPFSDVGGTLNLPTPSGNLTLADIKPAISWTPISANPVYDVPGSTARHYTGVLEPASVSGQPPRAGLEILIPDWDPQPDDIPVIVINAWSTFHPGPNDRVSGNATRAPHGYPGTNTGNGLRFELDGENFQYKPGGKVIRPTNGTVGFIDQWPPATLPAGNWYPVSAYIIPTVGDNPLITAMQRNLQLLEAVKLALNASFTINAPTDEWAVLSAGGSHGGFVSALSTLYYPEFFHASVSAGHTGHLRRALGDQESNRYVNSLSAALSLNQGYKPRMTADYPRWAALEGTDFVSASLATRFQADELPRPMLFALGDEDPVSNGNEWIPLLLGSPTATMPPGGISHTASGMPFAWMLWNKSGHAVEWYHQAVLPFSLQVVTDDFTDLLYEMLNFAIWQRTITPPSIPRMLSAPNRPNPEDGAEHYLVRNPQDLPGPKTGPLNLSLNTGFARHGHGATLGQDESLVIAPVVTNALTDHVFVGSADGVVSRFTLDPSATGTAASPGMVLGAQSMPLGGGVRSLGYGVWGLAVGDLDGDQLTEVVAASHREIFVLDALSLVEKTRRLLPAGIDYLRPGRIALSDIDPNTAGVEILFRTHGGNLVVLDKDLNTLARHPEGGIVDFAVVDQAKVSSTSFGNKAVCLLSERGHVFTIEMDPVNNVPAPGHSNAWLVAASDPQYGSPRDLEVYVDSLGKPFVVALYTSTSYIHKPNTQYDCVRIFDPINQNLVIQFSPSGNGYLNPPGGAVPLLGAIADLEILETPDGTVLCILNDDHLILWNILTGQTGVKQLQSFAPTAGALALRAVPSERLGLGAGDHVIVISTASGHVSYVRRTEVEGSSLTFSFPAAAQRGAGSGVNGFERCNATVAATWGMVARDGVLEVVDQSATRWGVDVQTGAPTLRHECRDPSGRLIGRPIRDLVAMEPLAGSVQVGPGPALGTGVPQHDSSQYTVPQLPTGVTRAFELRHHPWMLQILRNDPLVHADLYAFDGYVPLPRAGDHRTAGGHSRIAWWTDVFENPLQTGDLASSLRYTATQFAATLDDSTLDLGTESGAVAGFVPAAAAPDRRLRSNENFFPEYDHQSLRFVDPGWAADRNGDGVFEAPMVLSTRGGSVQLRDSERPTHQYGESDDFGLGGIGLAVADIDGDGTDTVYFATLAAPAHPNQSGPSANMLSSLQVLDVTGGTPTLSQRTLLDVYGVCGLAVADLPGFGTRELIVTTFGGDLLVFEIQSNGMLGNEIFRQRFDGALGAYNSILVEDLDASNGTRPEIYIATTRGILRLDT